MSAFDRFLHLWAPELEYRRSDLAANTRFVGPLPPTRSEAATPSWWDDLDRTLPWCT